MKSVCKLLTSLEFCYVVEKNERKRKKSQTKKIRTNVAMKFGVWIYSQDDDWRLNELITSIFSMSQITENIL